jgi:effector-binding domain-containing protein
LLVPARIDPASGYRYYDAKAVERARVLVQLRDLKFALSEIREILENYDDEADILDYLEKQKQVIAGKLRQYRDILGSLQQVISKESEARRFMQATNYEVQVKTLAPLLVAGIRMKGKYSDCGKAFGRISKSLWRHINGKCLCLHYDTEYREGDADFEACMPIRERKDVAGIDQRELPGGRCVSLLHQGPYELLGRSYAKILDYVRQHNYEVVLPTREIYLKGPGMIFRGNPKKYLTEIQMLIKE